MTTKQTTNERQGGGPSLNARDRVIASPPAAVLKAAQRLRSDQPPARSGCDCADTVYRSLSRLIAAGVAHRLESLNAFVRCTHACNHGTAMFAICDGCGAVTEFEDEVVADRLATWAQSAEFSVARTTVEFRGRCRRCGREDVSGAGAP